MNTIKSFTPARILAGVLLLSLGAAALTTWLALATPWLGLSLVASPSGAVVVRASRGPAAAVPAGARLLGLAPVGDDPAMAVQADDLMEEPDVIVDYAAMAAFFQRQDRLAGLLALPTVRLDWRTADGSAGTSVVEPARRPLASLPPAYWFQIAVGVVGCLLAAWVWALRPRDWGARMFAATGLMLMISAFAAAVYSSRELALDGTVFFWLSGMNHFGAVLFGMALVGIFLCYPRPLLAPRHLAWLPVIGLALWLADLLRLAPDQNWGARAPPLLALLVSAGLAWRQWQLCRASAADRAALRWFILSTFLGSSLAALTVLVPATLGWLPPLPQAYAFGFFLIIYAGLALGLRRYRLFDLDEWAYRILLWVGGAVLVVGLDSLLIAGLHLDPAPSLALTLLVCGWFYFPARQWLWQRIAHRPRLQLHELMPDLVEIAFKPSRLEQEGEWTALLRRLYDPLELAPLDTSAGGSTGIAEDGLVLLVPSCGGLAGRRLCHADRGSRLFSAKDAAFVATLAALMERADASRDAFDRGAQAERRRIARDMHDDVGARLLMLIHRAHNPEMAELARAAMTDLRTVLSTLEQQPVQLADALADWQVELAERCDAAGVALDWQVPEAVPAITLPPRHKAALERVVREAVSNALKHAGPRRIRLDARFGDDAVELGVEDDGATAPAAQWQEGRGLRGMRQRLADVGGQLAVETRPHGGHRLAASLPLPYAGAGAAA
jgi:signal transduction histidine kinase